MHEEPQSAHEQPAEWALMVHAKQVQPCFTALVARCTTGAIAPAVRLAKAGEEPIADMTSACSGGEELMERGHFGRGGPTEARRGCGSPATPR